MTFSFHHHLRNGDYVVNMVMKAAIEELGLKDLTIAATSLGEAHDPIAEYIEEGKVVGIQTSGIRGRMWFERMKADRLGDLLSITAAACGGEVTKT